MKKYIKPSIEELNIGATMPLMQSISGGLTESEEPGYSSDNFASGRKDKDYDFGDEDW